MSIVIRFTAVLITLVLTAPAVAKTPETLPVLYEINAPFYYSEPHTVTVHQTEGLSVGVANPDDQSALQTSDDGSQTLTFQGMPFAAGPRTSGQLAKGQNIGRWYFRINDNKPLQDGEHHYETDDSRGASDKPDTREWWVDNLSVDWQRGDDDARVAGLQANHYVLNIAYDYHRIEHDEGDRTDEHVEAKREFWFAEALPFSPLQQLPLYIGNDQRYVCFSCPAGGRVNETVHARLADKLRDAGMLVRTRLTTNTGETATVEVSSLEAAPDLDMSRYAAWPAIPASRSRVAVGALMLSKFLSQAPSGNGSAQVTFDAETPDSAREIKADSAYFKVNEVGDLAIASTFSESDGAKGMLMLLRPYHGAAQAGSFETAPDTASDALKDLSGKELKARARRFQVVGVLEHGDALTIYMSTGEGGVTITETGEDRLAGEFDLTMQALDTFGDGGAQTRQVTGQFDAEAGLQGRMRSATSKLLSD